MNFEIECSTPVCRVHILYLYSLEIKLIALYLENVALFLIVWDAEEINFEDSRTSLINLPLLFFPP